LLFSLKQYTYTIIISKTSIRIIAVKHIPNVTNVYIYCIVTMYFVYVLK